MVVTTVVGCRCGRADGGRAQAGGSDRHGDGRSHDGEADQHEVAPVPMQAVEHAANIPGRGRVGDLLSVDRGLQLIYHKPLTTLPRAATASPFGS